MVKKKPRFSEEKIRWDNNIDCVIGLDEVGRGAFAGPIVAAGVVFAKNFKHSFLRDVNDSKLLKPQQREILSEQIILNAKHFAIESIDIDFINRFGIGKANTAVFRKVLNKLISEIGGSEYFILIDGFHRKYLPGGIKKQKGIIKGDQKSLSIASASIIAKVYRDNLMKKAGRDFPNYSFEQNKGYGTMIHRKAITTHGASGFHRISFLD